MFTKVCIIPVYVWVKIKFFSLIFYAKKKPFPVYYHMTFLGKIKVVKILECAEHDKTSFVLLTATPRISQSVTFPFCMRSVQ
jgi:hypothetical protein